MAGIEEKLEAFFKQYIRNPNRRARINKELPSLKQSMMVKNMLDEMLSSGVIGDYEKGQITGEGEGTAIAHDQAGKLLELLKSMDGHLYIRFLMILKDKQRDLTRTLTGAYFDLLARNDLEVQFENSSATHNQPASSPSEESSAPVAKESGKDYAGYFQKYIALEGRKTILQESYGMVVNYLNLQEILPELVPKTVITREQKNEIERIGSEEKQGEALLTMLTRMSTKRYVAFLDVLSAMGQEHVLQKLAGSKYIPGEELRRNVDL